MVVGELEPRVRDAASLPNAAGASSAAAPRLVLLALGTLAITTAAWIDPLVGEALAGIHALLIATLFLVGAALLLAAATRATPWRPAPRPSRRYRLAASGVLAALCLAAVITIALAIGFALFSASTPRIYDSDASAFNQFNAELVLHGRNPYTADAAYWDAIHQFPDAGATPLRAGRYALSVYGPSLRQLVRDVRAELANPALRGPEFAPASLHSYPALAFLVYVPGVWLGLPTTLATSALFTILFLLAAGWGAPRGTRLWVGALLLANTLLVFWALRGSSSGGAPVRARRWGGWRSRRRPSSRLICRSCWRIPGRGRAANCCRYRCQSSPRASAWWGWRAGACCRCCPRRSTPRWSC